MKKLKVPQGEFVVVPDDVEGDNDEYDRERKPLLRFLLPESLEPSSGGQKRYYYYYCSFPAPDASGCADDDHFSNNHPDSPPRNKGQGDWHPSKKQSESAQSQYLPQSRWTLVICFVLLVTALVCWPLVIPFQDVMHLDHQGGSDGARTKTTNASPKASTTGYPLEGCSNLSGNQAARLGSNKKGCSPPEIVHQPAPFSAFTSSGTASSRSSPSVQSTMATAGSGRTSGFPSFLDFAGEPITVTYDAHSILLNDKAVLLLGGSMHPTRAASRREWDRALDEAVRNGLNLITLYVFWSAHQPYPDQMLDWTLPYSARLPSHGRSTPENIVDHEEGENWNLARAILDCGDRGLFVHLRLGPYVCAEYSYGGIPEWIGVRHPDIRMRTMDPNWLDLMESYIQNATAYMTERKLWAHQGGPIIMAQVENELFDNDASSIAQISKNNNKTDNDFDSAKVTKTEIQDYANWCGDMVKRVAPEHIVWTMCNGLSANQTIETFNGDWAAISWLEGHGFSGRIQIDQPALWTEDEQGFQIWGETPEHPVDYFWGITARDVSKNALRWLARGAVHLNYYMWWGGYNRGRTAAAGILNAYATDAVLCPSGERRQPKFGHLSSLHHVLASIAPLLTTVWPPPKPQPVEIQEDQTWIIGKEQVAFIYIGVDPSNKPMEAIFLENNSDNTVVARVPTESSDNDLIMELQPFTVAVLVDGNVAFVSATTSPTDSSFARIALPDVVSLLDWTSWREPVVTITECRGLLLDRPVEQTKLLQSAKIWSDYAWYSTQFILSEPVENITLYVETEQAMGMLVYIDGKYWASDENHVHGDGRITFQFPIYTSLSCGRHDLAILSESLGYHNLILKQSVKFKGITGGVTLVGSLGDTVQNISLTSGSGNKWCSIGGLQGELLGLDRPHKNGARRWRQLDLSPSTYDGPVWMMAYFDTPLLGADQRLFLELTSGRGHIWLNGHDLGRFWNLTRPENSTEYSQRYYHLPQELLTTDGVLNELVLFNAFGDSFHGNADIAQLVISWIETSSLHSFPDIIGFADSCLV